MGIDPLNSINPEKAIRVGIGLIEREGSYLIRQRRAGQAMAGYWEFPGGKAEPGETVAETTLRECFEEVGVKVLVGQMVHHVVHRYDHGLVELHYFRCRIDGTSAEPSAESGFEWVAADDLLRYRFPEANDKVIEILALEASGAQGSL
jgi:8-oxo-dGTP diphosphatase